MGQGPEGQLLKPRVPDPAQPTPRGSLSKERGPGLLRGFLRDVGTCTAASFLSKGTLRGKKEILPF